MRPVPFPCSFVTESLCSLDFEINDYLFREAWSKLIPTADGISFLTMKRLLSVQVGLGDKDTSEIIGELKGGGNPLKAGFSTLLFPLGLGDDELVAVARGVDPVVVERASNQWLAEINSAAKQECLRIKEAGSDPLSCLYNLQSFHEFLMSADEQENLHAVLVELLPRSRQPKESYAHVWQASHDLKEFNRYRFPLFHLGQAVFAFIITGHERDYLKSFCMSLITFLKAKKFRRVHCGYSSSGIQRSNTSASREGNRIILDEAWHALHAACRRGPFAFCDYDFLANPKHFPLVPIARTSRTKLQSRWRSFNQFALICLKPDFEPGEELDDIVRRHLRGSNLVVDERHYFIIKPNCSAQRAENWANQKIERIIEAHGEGSSMSAGVSCYPFQTYSKTEIVRNCQKALLHGSFFGPASVVVFDSLSLNVSGDVYFGEGDLTTAIREYRKGLELASADINLLNSLGVTYALMNRTTEALATFKSVLKVSPDNFMALYNKGLSEQTLGNYPAAIKSFTRAQDVCDHAADEETVSIGDLNFQLGVAYYHTGRYKRCIDQLENWYAEQSDMRAAGKCCRYIGISQYRLNNNPEASKWLQRSLSYDEFDAESLSLLGELYLAENQGDEIALSLCEKSVELDPTDNGALLRLAQALSACGDDNAASECFVRCAALKETRHEAWLALARLHYRNGDESGAKHYVSKMMRSRDVTASLRKKGQAVLRKINKKRK